MRALSVVLYGGASQRHLATWHAHYIKFHTLLRHRVHADFHPKSRNKKWERDATFAVRVQSVVV